MKLAELMRKSVSVAPANDKAAKVANYGLEACEPLAGLAALALANPAEAQCAALNPADETRIRAWLTRINETDAAMIAETLRRCASDPEALEYFLWRSAEVPATVIDPDKADALACGMTDCRDCRQFRGTERVCGASRCPTPKTLFRRCEHYRERPQR